MNRFSHDKDTRQPSYRGQWPFALRRREITLALAEYRTSKPLFSFHSLSRCIDWNIPLLENGSSCKCFAAVSDLLSCHFITIRVCVYGYWYTGRQTKENIFAYCNPERSIAQIPKPCTGYSSESPSRLVEDFRFLNFRIRTSGMFARSTDGWCWW
jgi:hypothetical protein